MVNQEIPVQLSKDNKAIGRKRFFEDLEIISRFSG